MNKMNNYTLQKFKNIFDNHGHYSFNYRITKKTNDLWATNPDISIEYYNIIVEIKDKNEDYIFFTDENVFDLNNGENMICTMCVDILIGDYNIPPEEFSITSINMEKLENEFMKSLQIL